MATESYQFEKWRCPTKTGGDLAECVRAIERAAKFLQESPRGTIHDAKTGPSLRVRDILFLSEHGCVEIRPYSEKYLCPTPDDAVTLQVGFA